MLTFAILFIEREKKNNKIKLDFRWKQTHLKQPKNSAKQKNKQNQRETQRSSFIAEAINANYFSNLKQRMNEPKWMEKKNLSQRSCQNEASQNIDTICWWWPLATEFQHHCTDEVENQKQSVLLELQQANMGISILRKNSSKWPIW